MAFTPMLAKVGDKNTFNLKGWTFEPKYDGTRIFVVLEKGKIKLINRRKNDITHRYPELQKIKNNISENTILDGELVILEKGKPNFNLLQRREHLQNKAEIQQRSKKIPATIYIFDILKKANKDLRKLALKERQHQLQGLIKQSSSIKITPSTSNGKELWSKLSKIGFEGVIAKNLKGKYISKRSKEWLKIKNLHTIDAVILGYTTEKRKISALALGAYHKGKMIFIGKVASGLSEERIKTLLKKLIPTKPNPNIKIPTKKITWVKPNTTVEAKYLQITKYLKLRAPVLVRIRDDKPLKDCTI